MEILGLIAVVGITWFLLHVFFYSPKAQIKRLWREVFGYARQIGQWKDVEGAWPVVHGVRHRKAKAGNLINALLEYNFPNQEDEEQLEYVNENKYEST